MIGQTGGNTHIGRGTGKRENMIKLPLVSIVVTNYNYGEFIEECLAGILVQSYRRIECIIVDDCSTDDSASKIESFIEKNKNSDITFTLIKNKETHGQLAGFLTGLNHSSGIFIGFVDADDIILPDYVNTHINAHLRTSVAMTVSQQIEIDDNGEIHTLRSIASPQMPRQDEHDILSLKFEDLKSLVNSRTFSGGSIALKVLSVKTHKFGGWHWGPTSNLMFRKSALAFFDFGDVLEHWKYCADYLLSSFAHLIGGSCIIYAPLAAYRRHSKNGFTNKAVTGDVRYFSQSSRDTVLRIRKAILTDTLALFLRKKDQLSGHMDSEIFESVIGNMIRGFKTKEIEPNMELLEKLLSPEKIKKVMENPG